jgi:hypothetical protein
MTWQAIGLSIYVATTLGAVAILGYDYYLYRTGQVMITTYCRANPWAAYLILMALCGGVMGLAVHFMSIVDIEWRQP